MLRRFAQKTCVVTGGATGIGRAAALRFAGEGAHIVVGDIDEEGMASLVAEVHAGGGTASAHHTDVSRAEDVRTFVARALAERPSIDVVLANAAILDPARLEDLPPDRFLRTVNANLVHPFVFVREAAAGLRASGGSVILMASTGGLRGIVGQSAYSSTKAGVINLTRVLAAELGQTVRVNCNCTGWVDTQFKDTIWAMIGREREPELLRRVPLGRQGHPEEIAAAAAFLASEDASYITGHALVVDGGMTAV